MKLTLLLLLIQFTVCTQFNISSEQCLNESCLTLSQFTSNTSKYLDSNTTLVLMLEPGKHLLNSELTISNVEDVLIMSVQSDATIIVCGSPGRLDFKHVRYVHISGMNFVGCTNNRFFSIKQFHVESTSFLSLENVPGRALNLVETKGRIVDSLFGEMMNSVDAINGAIRLTEREIAFVKMNRSRAIVTVVAANNTDVSVRNCQFTANHGGVFSVTHGVINLIKSQFTNNTSTSSGGTALWAVHSMVNITECEFKNNSALTLGGAVKLKECNITVIKSIFSRNRAESGGALYLSSLFDYPYEVVMTISGSSFNDNAADSIGGAIHFESLSFGYHRAIIFKETVTLSNNYARTDEGGALYLYSEGYDFKAFVQGKLIVSNNTAERGRGGGIYLSWIKLSLIDNSSVELIDNYAGTNGGGMYALSSTIMVGSSNLDDHYGELASIHFLRNRATNGGGLHLCDSVVYGYTSEYSSPFQDTVKFTANSAILGGALFLEESCPTLEIMTGNCFLQTRPTFKRRTSHFNITDRVERQNRHEFKFSENVAKVSGSAVYKETFQDCMLDSRRILDFESLIKVSDIKISDIGSHSIQVCLCKKGHPDCTYQIDYIKAINGKEFIIEAAIADRGNHVVNGSINSQIEDGLIREDQRYQDISGECTPLKFNIFSAQGYQRLTMVPVVTSPYITTNLSSRVITIQFPYCIFCPIGFEIRNAEFRLFPLDTKQ